MDHSTLAIIIPAYKSQYLASTLASLQEQTDNRFTVYIGDDCSPNELTSIIDQFSSEVNIIYHRFDENMGSISLTKQWERCVALSTEEWIWLFSDDDIIERNAVENFYKSLNGRDLLYKFPTKIIDEKGDLKPYYNKFDRFNNFEDYVSSDVFISNRLKSNGYRSFAVEYIFHRSLFLNAGFIDFPLAWNSDDATWFSYSIANGGRIKMLNSCVYWRLSTSNITSDTTSNTVIKQKVDASLLYIDWLNKLMIQHNLQVKEYMFLRWFSIQMGIFMPHLSIKDFGKFVEKLPYSFNHISIYFYFLRFVKFQGLKHNLRSLLNIN